MRNYSRTNDSGDYDTDEPRFVSADERRFYCPLSRRTMTDPVLTPRGNSFERKALSEWMERHGEICPLSGEGIDVAQIKPNFHLQWEILYWKRQQQQAREIPFDRYQSLDGKDRPTDASRMLERPPFPPSKCVDSPPTRPRRRGSASGAVEPGVSAHLSSVYETSTLVSPQTSDETKSSARMCVPPQRSTSYHPANPIYWEGAMISDGSDDEDDTMPFDKLVILLDEAIRITAHDFP